MKYRVFMLLSLLSFTLMNITPLAAQDVTECEDGFRLYTHALGDTCIPTTATRIVAVGSEQMEAMLALDVIPVGFATWTGMGNQADVPLYIANVFDLSASVFLGGESEPNLEAIIALEPDLIFVSDWMTEVYPLVSQIAPTVALTWWNADEERAEWKQLLLEMGEILGRTETAETTLEDYEARVTLLRELGEAQETPLTVSFLRFLPSEVRAYLNGSYGGAILQEAGIARPASQDKDGFVEIVSLETLENADGDIMLIAQSDPDGTLYEQFSDSPLWQLLTAVQNERVYEVDYNTWIGGGSVIAAQAILDDLFIYVAGVDPQEVSPNPFLVDEAEATPEVTEEAPN